MLDVTFARPDLTTFCRLDDLGLEVVGQHLGTDRAVLTRTYTPDPNFHGEDFFTFNARRGGSVPDAARVDIDVQAVNDAPTAVDDSFSTDEDTVLNVVGLDLGPHFPVSPRPDGTEHRECC